MVNALPELDFEFHSSEHHYPIREEINSTDVNIVGVTHTEEFFEEFEEYFQEWVSNTDAVLLEQPVSYDFWQSNFFGEVGRLAYDEAKNVYQADPNNVPSSATDLSITVGSAFMMAATILTGSGDMISETYNAPLNDYVFYLSASYYAFQGSILGEIIATALAGNVDENFYEGSWRDFLTWGKNDYRNVMIAKGIEKITEKEDLDSLVSIHGAAHADRVQRYLEHPKIRKAKEVLYTPYKQISRDQVRKYSPLYDSEGFIQKWGLEEEF